MKSLFVAIGFACAALAGASAASAQVSNAPPAAIAYAEDGASIEALIEATYAVISGPAGQKRDWDRFRALFVEGAFMIPRSVGAAGLRRVTPEDYIARSGPLLERDGFYENELSREVRVYGDIAQVFSTYETRRTPQDAAPFMRGINAFQLVRDGQRWRIASLIWQQEAESLPIPAAAAGQ